MISIDSELRLEPVTIPDASYLLYLKNDQGSRASALVTQTAIDWDDHIVWLQKTLLRDDVEFFIIRDTKGESLGSWRFDHHPEHEEFSMIIDPAKRGKRLGSRVFGFCSDYIQRLTGKTIICFTAEGNVPAMRYHISNGYTLESHDAERRCYVWKRDRSGFYIRQSKNFC